MDVALSKKINLLIHLAKVDGKFAKSEKQLLRSILEENKLHSSYLETHEEVDVDFDELKQLPDGTELLYWVLKLIQVDNELHPAEISYSKMIARQLEFSEEIVDHFNTKRILSPFDFKREAVRFKK